MIGEILVAIAGDVVTLPESSKLIGVIGYEAREDGLLNAVTDDDRTKQSWINKQRYFKLKTAGAASTQQPPSILYTL